MTELEREREREKLKVGWMFVITSEMSIFLSFPFLL